MLIPSALRSNDDDLIMSFSDVPLWSGVQQKPGVKKSYPLDISAQRGPIMQCTSQEVIQNTVDAYQLDEYKFITAPPGSSHWANTIGQAKLKTLESIFSKDKSPQKILEIGAGSTWIANELTTQFKPESYVIVDPSVQEKLEGVEVIQAYFPHEEIVSRKFDMIMGFSVLEHVPDPVLFLNQLKHYLEDDGVAVLVYPDCEDQIRRGDINVLIHEHLSYFTNASSHWLAETCGFHVNSLKSENDCFTIELSLAEKSKSSLVMDEVALLDLGIDSFRSLFTDLRRKIANFLDSGKTVGFHGATNGLNIFLHICKLGDHPNIYIYDGDSSKQGFYIPACTSRIRSPTDSCYATHALMVISALSFFDQISRYCIEQVGLNESQLLRLEGV